ncbi:MAG: hypothetical protein AB1458_12305 [Bacteroidota bacterium]
MKKLILAIFVFKVIPFYAAEPVRTDFFGVNALLGDIGFVKKFGRLPDELSDRTLRIQTHLQYVEGLLRSASTAHLSAAQKENRNNMLGLLHDYWTAGDFPLNYDYATRRPCFIDKDGNICAVGYLVQQTAGQEAADKINSLYKYSYITEMQLPELEGWIAASGLSETECAMIQPAYEPYLVPPIYADGGLTGLQEYLAKNISLDSKKVDSAHVSFTVDTSGLTKNVKVKASEKLKMQIKTAMEKAVYKPAYYQGWGSLAGKHEESNVSFRLVFNLPADSIYFPQLIDCRGMPGLLKPDSAKQVAKIILSRKDKNVSFNSLTIVQNGKQPDYSYSGAMDLVILCDKSQLSSGSTITLEIKGYNLRTIVLKNIPFNDQALVIPFSQVNNDYIFYPYYAPPDMRIPLRTSVKT